MRFTRITLQHFRNIAWADLKFEGRQHFFHGLNGQGKTNLLEAAGFFSALRSFRLSDNRGLIAHGQPEAALACEVEHEQRGATQIVIRLRPGGKEVTCDQEKVARLGDYLGRFPTVVFSSQDQQLVRGAPGLRRRWLDQVLASTDGSYLEALQRFHRALAERNRLLKTGAKRDELVAFEQPLAAAAEILVAKRELAMTDLSVRITAAYTAIAGVVESAEAAYIRSSEARTAADWISTWERSRARDVQMRSTLVGPHRDDCELLIKARAAREFASEGQQRTLATALRLAEVAYLRDKTHLEPVLLADDVLGELDAQRRRRFWTSLGEQRQIIATGTSLPEADLGQWQIFQVDQGAFVPSGPQPV